MAKLMLVEDDNSLREIYQARLAAEGYDTVTAKDGEEALALVGKEKPDLIILDVMMPKISGFDTLDILKSTPATKDTKVIMMSALSQTEDKIRAEKLGANRYLVKSQVTLEDIVKSVKEVLDEGADDGLPAGVVATDEDGNTNEQATTEPASTESSEPTQEATVTPVADITSPVDAAADTSSVAEPVVDIPTADSTTTISSDSATSTDAAVQDDATTAQEEATVTEQINDFAKAADPVSTPSDSSVTVDAPAVDVTPPSDSMLDPAPAADAQVQSDPNPLTDDASGSGNIPTPTLNLDSTQKPELNTIPEPAITTPVEPTESTPTPVPVTPVEDTGSNAPQTAGGTKVIQPIETPQKATLDELLAKEDAATPPPADEAPETKPEDGTSIPTPQV